MLAWMGGARKRAMKVMKWNGKSAAKQQLQENQPKPKRQRINQERFAGITGTASAVWPTRYVRAADATLLQLPSGEHKPVRQLALQLEIASRRLCSLFCKQTKVELVKDQPIMYALTCTLPLTTAG